MKTSCTELFARARHLKPPGISFVMRSSKARRAGARVAWMRAGTMRVMASSWSSSFCSSVGRPSMFVEWLSTRRPLAKPRRGAMLRKSARCFPCIAAMRSSGGRIASLRITARNIASTSLAQGSLGLIEFKVP